MNVKNDAVSSNPMASDFGFQLPSSEPVEKAGGKRASNDATVEAPISADEAMALCMAASAIGG